MLTWFLLGVGWIASSLLIAGWSFAYYRGRWPELDERSDASFALWWALLGGLMGPLGVLQSFFLTQFARYGWRFPRFERREQRSQRENLDDLE
jgi:hypothetical protein